MAIQTQTEVDSKEVAEWEARFKNCQEQRRTFEEQWYTNLAFYKGKQWAVWRKNSTGNRLIDPAAPRNRVRLVTNLIKPTIRKEHSKINKKNPIFYVSPNTTEPADVASARIAEAIAEFSMTQSHLNRARRQSTFWMCITGTSFLKVTCGAINGVINVEPVSSFHIFIPDIQEETLSGQSFIIHARALTRDAVYNQWKVDVEPDVNVAGNALEQKLFQALGISESLQSKNKLVFIKEIWVPPGKLKDYPDGAMLVIGGGKMIYKYHFSKVPVQDVPVAGMDNPLIHPPQRTPTSYPYEHNKFPFVKLDHVPSGCFYSMSTMEDLISPQRELNKLKSQITEVKNRTAKPDMVFIKGSIDPTKLTSEPGLMIPLSPGFEHPRYMQAPELPGYVMAQEDRIHSDWDQISSQFELHRSGQSFGVKAAAAIAFMTEENDSILYTTIASLEEAMEEVGQQTLSLVQQFWDSDKIIQVVSENGTQDTEVFKVANINGNTDLKVEAGSMAPDSKAARQAFIIELIDRGLPFDKALRYLDMNETKRMYEELQVDARKAQRENITMAKETNNLSPYPTNPWDDNSAHLYEHGLFMKSNEFELLSPNTQQVFANHYLIHQQELEKSIAGAPGPGSPQSQPKSQQRPNQPSLPGV